MWPLPFQVFSSIEGHVLFLKTKIMCCLISGACCQVNYTHASLILTMFSCILHFDIQRCASVIVWYYKIFWADFYCSSTLLVQCALKCSHS
jgi:hypothetical protein